MRIAFDVSPLSHTPTGVNNYIRGSLAGLAAAAEGRHEIVAFAPTSLRGPSAIRRALAGIDIEIRLWPLPASHALRTGWSRLGWPSAERLLGRLDVLHFSDWMYPPQRAGVRATTIHDLVPIRFPEWVTPRTRAMHSRKYANTVRTCDLVFVNSGFTGRDVVELLHVPRERVHVARPGIKAEFTRQGPAADLGAPYALTVATLEPRKNLQALVEAHRLLDGALLLAVAGGEGWGEQPLLDSSRVRRLGFVDDSELARLYRGAAVAVYPSRFEGFGMPILEAMACGCPVVASAHPSMDEASGDAAVRADPEDPAAIAAGIRTALAEREQLVARGLEHAAGFSWRTVGEIFLRGYEEALAAGTSRSRGGVSLPAEAGSAGRSREAPGGVRRPEEVMVVVWRRGSAGPEFLVLERSPERQGYWHLVAGALDAGEKWVDAAVRELHEETGLDALVEDLALRFSYPTVEEPAEKQARLPPGVTEIAVAGFAAEAPAGWEPTLDDEHVSYRWLPAEEAALLLRYDEPRDAVLAAARRLERS